MVIRKIDICSRRLAAGAARVRAVRLVWDEQAPGTVDRGVLYFYIVWVLQVLHLTKLLDNVILRLRIHMETRSPQGKTKSEARI